MFDAINPGSGPVAKDFTLPISRRPGAGSGYCTTRRECALPPQGSRGTEMNCSSEEPGGSGGGLPTGCVMSRLSATGPRRSSLRRRLRPRENAVTLLRGARACLALLAAAALLALAAPAQAQTEVWSATLTTGDLSSGILGCSNGVGTARCSSTSVLSEDSFTYDSTAYNITGLFVRSNGQLEFIVDVDLTTTTLADLTLVVGSTSLVLSGGTASGTVKLIFSSSGVSLTAGTDITVKLTAPGTPNTAATGAPTITGTAQVGKTLTAVTTGITDADGLTSPTYTYQWIRVDGTDEEDISGENSSTYTLVDADLGKTIKVKVSFTDDASNAETLTSAATVTVAADTTPPEVESVTVPISGGEVELVFDEDLDETVVGTLLVNVFSLTVAGQAVTIRDQEIRATVLALYMQTGTIKQGQTVVLSYTDPTAGDDTVALQDSAGNDVASFTTGMSGVPAVTNDSTVVNTAPTAANKTVTTAEDRAYTFTADDFGFMDADTGDTLASVKIVTVPALGTLTFDRTGTAVTANDVVTKAQIDGDNMLTFTPARDAHGAPYTTFTFKVNDGTVDSADAYTMTIDVTDAPAPVCTAPSYGDRREIWTGTVTVAALETDGIVTSYGFDEVRSAGTLLPSQSFSIGSNDYMIEALEVSLGGIMFFSLDGLEQLTDREDVALRLHVCDGDYDFNTAGERFDVTTTTWLTTLDWSDPVVTRTVYLSLPANTAATGEPAITGTARAEQVLTADASPIMDTDGLPSSFTYQWVRVDADGTSNPVDITDANAETYTLTAADVVKKVKVKVSFTDELSGEEERTSAAYPSSGTVTVAGPNTAPTAANNTVTTGEDRPYAFDADDFGFVDTDTGDTLASVKIVTPPALGTLALDGTAVLADAVVTKAQIDADMLTFRPAQDAHGDAYTTFTFKVNDGTVDSADAYTMTIDVTDAPVPVCAAPSFGDRREIWSGVVTVEEFSFLGSVTGYGFESPSIGISSLLPSAEFSIGSNTYTIVGISVGNNGHLLFSLPSIRLTATERAALRLNVCDEDLDFSVALNEMDSSIYGWEATFDWSDPVVTRTLYLSLPANNGATGEPTISGTAQAGQVLTADASPILDTDGLTGVDFTYQWVRVDADGMSNPADITDATAATYTLTAADAGKKVKVQVSFTDELSGEEERTSAAYPSSGTVIASANTTAPELTSVTVTSTPRKTTDTYGAREHIEFTMTFDAPVTVTGDPTFDFDLGGPSTASWYAGSGTTTLRFSHAVSGGSSGDQDTNGISWAMNAIELNGGTIAGTDNAVTAILTHAAQSNLAGHKVDGRTTAVTPATVTDVVVTSTPMSMASGSSTADTYGFGETIVITVTVSEAVEVVGDPEFKFSLSDMGGPANDVPATYDRTRSSPTTIVFTYTVQAGDRDNNGIWIGDHSRTFMLDANDRIRTASQQIDIDRSHPEKSTHTGHKVDGSLGAPTVPPDPTAPTLVSATATTLTIEWTHPGNGGSPLTRNFVHYRVEGTTDWTNWYAGETPVTRAVITNLEAETAYDVRVHSSNAIGNSQWAQSATAFSTLAGTASCAVPTFTGRRKIWTAVLTMGDFTEYPHSLRGYDSNPESGDGGGLDPAPFTLGSRDYDVGRIALVTTDANNLNFVAGQGQGEWWDSTVLALQLHVCNTNFDFSDSSYEYTDEDRIVIESNHVWATDLDWSGVTTRTVHMSLPLNRPATGAPLITGPATVGQELAVDVTGIEDEDGLHDIEYTYQWVRVDADGTSNEGDITDATADTYTLTDDDLGKKVKIEVSFADDFGSDEQRTSAPTDTVTAVAMTTPGVTVSTTALTVTEEDTTGATYTVVLNSQPTATVTVTVAGHAGTDVTPSPTSLTFTTTTWGTAQTVTVTAGDDADAVNDSVALTHSAASTDSEYQGITIAGVAVTVTDNDNDAPPGVTVSTPALTVTEEDPTGATYTVVLNSEPTATVTVTVAGHADTDVTPSPTSLTFTPMNWGTAQTVTVTAGDDADTANDTVTLTHSAASTDSDYQGITIAGVTVTVTDNDDNDTAPGAPRDLRTAPGDGRVTLAWTAPGSDGGAAIEKYRYRVSANAGSSWDPDWTDVPDGADTGDSAADETTFTVSGLINGTEYVFELRAVNSVGEGRAASAADTPVRAPLPPGSGFLVGNFGQPADGAAQIYVTHDIVGVFTTGARGADLHNIELRLFTRRPNIAVLPIPSVTLYRASVTDSRATRGARVAALTAVAGSRQPANTAQTVAFAAPSGTRLDAGATYLVVLEHTFPVSVESTTYPAEDAGGAPGWAIDGIGAGNNSPYSYRTTASLLMRVNGTAAGATVATAPEAPASLGARAGDAEVTLRWAPPRSDGGAGIEKYQVRYSAGSRVDPETGWTDVPDGSDTGTSLADERSVSVTELDNGRQYAFELRAVNRVRAGAAATATATPAAPRRSGFLVSNFGQPVDGSAQIYVTKDIVGVFTTGALGATLDSIELRLFTRRPNIAVLPIPSVTLYRGSVTDTRATPGTRVATLTAAPGSRQPANTAQTVAFAAPSGTRLDAGATYLVVLEHTSYVRVESTHSSAQDAGGASGWTIDGVGAGNSSPYSYGTSDSLLMSVNGTAARAQRAVREEEQGVVEEEEKEEQEEPDPDRGISLSTSSSSAIEGEAVTISVRRAGPTDRTTTVAVQVLDSALTDAWPIDVELRSGVATTTATVAIPFDGARPASRTVTVSLASVEDPYSVGSPSTLTFNVTERDAALSVADASVSEGPGARLAFAVTLDRTRDREVRVKYATTDGTATQGDDYTGVSGTLRFAPGETTKTVSVPVLDDAHDEGSETLTLTLSSPRRAVIDDGTAVGTIVNSDPLPNAWLSRFGRAASDHVVQSIGRRLEGGARESHLTVMGWRVDTLLESTHSERDAREPRADAPGRQPEGSVAPDGRIGAAGAMAGGTRGFGAMSDPGAARPTFDGAMTQGLPPMQGGTLQSPARAVGASDNRWLGLMERLLMSLGPNGGEAISTPGLRDMVMGSSFYYGYSPDAGTLRGMNRLTAWGESAATRFSGAEGKLSLDGEVNTAIVGADGEWGRWLAGLALSYSEGEGGYRRVSAKGGAVSSTLAGINPYARYRLDERTSFWATLGYGSGRLILTPDGAESALETDMTNAMAAFGGRGVLSMRAGDTGQFELALRSDAMLTDTASMAVPGLSSGAGATSRIRLILEGSGSLPAFGGVLAPKVEAGLRYDGGDAETGAGLEVGGGLAYDMARLTVQVDGRVLLTHRDRDYEEWGYSLSFEYKPASDGRGLRYQAGSQWGATQSGVQSLWSLQNAGGLANGARTASGQRYTAELGYGFGVGRLWYPYVATESGGASSQALRFGLNLNAGSALEAGLEIGWRAHLSGQIENEIQLQWQARW